MHPDQTPDRPVPSLGNPRSGGQGPRHGRPGPDYRRPAQPRPDDQEPRNPRANQTRPDGQGFYSPRRARPEPGDQAPSRRGPARPWPGNDQGQYGDQGQYRPGADGGRRPQPAGAPASRPTRAEDPWASSSRDPRPAKPKDPWSTADNDPWASESNGAWATSAHGFSSVDSRTELLPPGPPKRDDPPKRSAPAKRGRSMRQAVMVSSALGVVLVLAIGMVALAVSRGSASGSTSAGAQASNVTKASQSKTAAATKAATKAKAKSSAKPTPSHTVKKAAAASTKAAAPALLTVPAGWQLTFDPSFSGSSLSSTWSTCYDWATPSVGCTNNPTAEKEWYLPSQVSQSGGTLNLTATQESTPGTDTNGAAETFTCRSGMVSSKPGFNFTYGLIQISAKLPYGPGLWPALWLAASNDQWPPELDIMEHWYSEPQYKVYDHTVGKQYLGGPVPTPGDLSAGFHTFSLLWTKDRVTWYVDGSQVFTTTSYVPQQAMYFIANVADDSTAKGACTGTMQIQSIKVWQP